MSTKYIGKPESRVDGRAKVTGEAKYAGEYNIDGLIYGCVVSSAIAKGKITAIDTSAALQLKGVLQVFTHENVPGLAWFDRSYKDQDAPSAGSPYRPLHSAEILFSQQPVALVVAETFEIARYATSLVKITYEAEKPVSELKENLDKAREPKKSRFPPVPRGKADEKLAESLVVFETQYYHGTEHHNPMEPHASTVHYKPGGKLVVYDKTQGVLNSQDYISKVFGLSKKKVQVLAPFVGGAFGSGLRPQYQLFMAVLAAMELKRSVRVTLARQQMFSFGHRPATLQKFKIGADKDGTVQALQLDCISETSSFEDYTENIVNWAGLLYKFTDIALGYKVVPLDEYTPLDMRAPGGATGVFAIEAAMDELAYKVGIDPLELRLKNYTDKDLNEDKPFSSKELRACYQQAADKFGWSARKPEPRSMKEGDNLIGYGMATGCWEAQQMPARAKASLSADGKLSISASVTDIGPGTYTIMAQIAAETLGIPIQDVKAELGDSNMTFSLLQGGSWTAGSIGSAVKVVCENVQKKLLKFAKKTDGSPFADAKIKDVLFEDGKLKLKADPAIAISYPDIMHAAGENNIEIKSFSLPNMLKQRKYSRYTHSAVFAEVKVDEDLGTIQVSRIVTAVAGGRILNPKTARSQVLGGIVWGIGMAMEEESYMDANYGRYMNHNLAEYHVPVNADVRDIEVIFVEENDKIVNPLGVKGLGEIGIVGVAAAILNAVYHATGKRVHELPITLDKLL